MQIKLITYNIDGLPEVLDLNKLPWILKPICWIYKLIKKTSLIKINDNNNTKQHIKFIGNYLSKSNADIITVQENFNYNDELYFSLKDNYISDIHSGKIDFSNIRWLPYPRFKADGLNLFANDNVLICEEQIIKWNKSNGYIDHANDLLTIKGFRFYKLLINNSADSCAIDLYNIHMDADFYHPENCPDVSKDIAARKSQFNQLLNYILNRYNYGINNPIIIIGDTNSYDKYHWDEENIKYFLRNINCIPSLHAQEAYPINYNDCDRVFFINNEKCKCQLKLKECYFDTKIEESDHKPLIGVFDIVDY